MSEKSLQADLQDLLETREAGRAQQKNLKNFSRVLSLVLIGVFVGSLAALYGQVTVMYSSEQFAGPLQEEANALIPKLEPELRKLWEETVPIYTELAVQKFESALPLLQERSEKELDALIANVSSNAEKGIHDALERLATTHQERIGEHFPNLATTHGMENSTRRWSSTLQRDSGIVLAHFHERYVAQLGELQATLDGFRPNDFEYLSEEQLTQQFLHLWLMKVDRMILNGDTGLALDDASGSTS